MVRGAPSAPATVVTSILVGGAVITGALQAVSKGGPPTVDLVAGYLLIGAAIVLIGVFAVRSAPQSTAPSSAAGFG